MSAWRVRLYGEDISASTAEVTIRASAGDIAAECEVLLADPAVVEGLVPAVVPQALAIDVAELRGGAWVPMGEFFLEEITTEITPARRTKRLWGRSRSARLSAPWSVRISRQWTGDTTIAAIIAEMANLAGAVVTYQAPDYTIRPYTYSVSLATPADIVREVSGLAGLELWPQLDGSLIVAPRRYVPGPPAMSLSPATHAVRGVRRQQPAYGCRVLVSGDAAVPGVSVQVAFPAGSCIQPGGTTTVAAIVIGPDGAPIADGTAVSWSAAAGSITPSSVTGVQLVTGERVQARDYYHIRPAYPPAEVVGIYAWGDQARAVNLAPIKGATVQGDEIVLAYPLAYYDQTLMLDYRVGGVALATYTAPPVQQDVEITATALGTVGRGVASVGNPVSCPSSISIMADPQVGCYGNTVVIGVVVDSVAGAAAGVVSLQLDGCGSLDRSMATLRQMAVTERLVAQQDSSAIVLRVSGRIVSGSTVTIYAAGGTTPLATRTSSDGKTVLAPDGAVAGTKYDVEYLATAAATAIWNPGPITTAAVQKTEDLPVQADQGSGVASITASDLIESVQQPIDIISNCSEFCYVSTGFTVAGRVVTFTDPWPGTPQAGQTMRLRYTAPRATMGKCSATITAAVEDGAEHGTQASLTIEAVDCTAPRAPGSGSVAPGGTYTGDDTTPPGGEPGEEPVEELPNWPKPQPPEETPHEHCAPANIVSRISGSDVSDVRTPDDCATKCSCQEICSALQAAGKLAAMGWSWGQCVTTCEQQQGQACNRCSLVGPTYLEPGEVGTWTDGLGNTGVYSGPLELVSQDANGYHLRMPASGESPMTIRVTYSATNWCEAPVSFPPCGVTGPTTLAPGQEGVYTISSAGAACAGVTATTTNMEVVRCEEPAKLVMRLKGSSCSGSASIYVFGRYCGSVTVASTIAGESGSVLGPDALQKGESGYYTASWPSGDLSGAQYTGSLPMEQWGKDYSAGTVWAICRMPDTDEHPEGGYTVSFAASCGRSATKGVYPIGPSGCVGYVLGQGYMPCRNFGCGMHPMVWCSVDCLWKTSGGVIMSRCNSVPPSPECGGYYFWYSSSYPSEYGHMAQYNGPCERGGALLLFAGIPLY